MMPDGLKYLGSWVEDNFDRCFQLMECDDPHLFEQWLVHWRDLGDCHPLLPVNRPNHEKVSQNIARV